MASLVPHQPPNATSPKDERPLWRRALPFVLALALVGLLVYRIDLRALVGHLARANYVGFVLFCTAFTLLLLAADSFATSFVYTRTVVPLRFSELFLIRGASYLPSLLNHHIGQAWLTWYLSRAKQAPLWRVAGATLLVYATTFGSLFLFLSFAAFFKHEQTPWVEPVLVGGVIAGLAYLGVIHRAPAFLSRRQILAPLFDAGVRGHLIGLALRVPHMAVLFLGSWLCFYFFDVRIPVGAAFAYVPVLMLVVALPITPQGVGTRDWVALAFFSQFAEGSVANRESAIAATTLSFVAVPALIQGILGSFLMHRVLRLLRSQR